MGFLSSATGKRRIGPRAIRTGRHVAAAAASAGLSCLRGRKKEVNRINCLAEGSDRTADTSHNSEWGNIAALDGLSWNESCESASSRGSRSSSTTASTHRGQQRPRQRYRSPPRPISRPPCSQSKSKQHTQHAARESLPPHGIVLPDKAVICASHPFVQLQCFSKRTGKWKTLMGSCPLCEALDDDESSAGSNDGSTITRSSSYSMFPSSEPAHRNRRLQLAANHEGLRSRSHSKPPRHLSGQQWQSTGVRQGPYCTMQGVEELRREGFHSLNFDSSAVTIAAANGPGDAEDLAPHHFSFSATAEGAPSIGSGDQAAKRVRFVDGREARQEGRRAVADAATCTSAIVFTPAGPLVTQVRTRPYMSMSEVQTLFYSDRDVRRFRNRAMLEILAERGILSSAQEGKGQYGRQRGDNPTSNQERTHVVHYKEQIDASKVETPLLHKLVFGVELS